MPTKRCTGTVGSKVPVSRSGALTLPDPAGRRRVRIRQPLHDAEDVHAQAGQRDPLAELASTGKSRGRAARSRSSAAAGWPDVLHVGSTASSAARPRLAALGDRRAGSPRPPRRRYLCRRPPPRASGGPRRPQQAARRLVRPAPRLSSERSRRRRVLPAARPAGTAAAACSPGRHSALPGAGRPLRSSWHRTNLRRAQHGPSRAGERRPGDRRPRQPPARAHRFPSAINRGRLRERRQACWRTIRCKS